MADEKTFFIENTSKKEIAATSIARNNLLNSKGAVYPYFKDILKLKMIKWSKLNDLNHDENE